MGALLPGPCGTVAATDLAVVEITRLTKAPPTLSGTDEGVNAQEEAVGNPVQLSAAGPPEVGNGFTISEN